MSPLRRLQIAVAIAGLVPVAAGLAGVLSGPAMTGDLPAVLSAATSLDSHFRYLSGLLLGIGLAFWSLIPRILQRGAMFRLLTAIVVLGGLGRLWALLINGWPAPSMLAGLTMELLVTPALCAWQAWEIHKNR
jgi:hypothetical protein